MVRFEAATTSYHHLILHGAHSIPFARNKLTALSPPNALINSSESFAF